MDTEDPIEEPNSDIDREVPSIKVRKFKTSYSIIPLGIFLLVIAAVLVIRFAPASWVSDDSYILSPGSANNTRKQSSLTEQTHTHLKEKSHTPLFQLNAKPQSGNGGRLKEIKRNSS